MNDAEIPEWVKPKPCRTPPVFLGSRYHLDFHGHHNDVCTSQNVWGTTNVEDCELFSFTSGQRPWTCRPAPVFFLGDEDIMQSLTTVCMAGFRWADKKAFEPDEALWAVALEMKEALGRSPPFLVTL
jgi:hypothetical protein